MTWHPAFTAASAHSAFSRQHRKSQAGDVWARYEQMKAGWIAAHPTASPEEYDIAMARIARELGV